MDKTKKVIWFASKNINKIKELQKILDINLKSKKIVVKSLLDINFKNIKENKKTIEENSLLKAKTLAFFVKKDVLADDSGLEIEELNNFPGTKSKRWAYPIIDEKKINNLLLKKCENLNNRNARLKTVITYYSYNDKKYYSFVGIINGILSKKQIGKNGFGYDSILYIDKYKKTLGELSFDEKNEISQRYIALKKFIKWIKKDNEKW